MEGFAVTSVTSSIGYRREVKASTQLALFRKSPPDAVLDVQSHVDWLELLDPDDDSITLVWFKAKWCRGCRRFARGWRRKIIPLAGDTLKLATVDVGANEKLAKDLGVNALPALHWYFRGDLLASTTCGPKDFDRLKTVIDHYVKASTEDLELEASLQDEEKSFARQVFSQTKSKVSKVSAPKKSVSWQELGLQNS